MLPPAPRHEYVSVREAAIRLGTSESDVRRKIRAGLLVAESLQRPGGTMLRVRFDLPEEAPEDEPEAHQPAPEPRQGTPEAVTLALVAQMERQAERVAALERENGRLQSDVSHATTRAETLQAERDAAQAELARLRARRWWGWLIGR